MSASVAPFGPARLPVVVALAVVLACLFAAPAFAIEAGPPSEGGPAPSIDEIGTQNDVSSQYLPEPAEAPPFMRFFYVPLIIGGFLIVGALLMRYLQWQPRFAEERRSKRRR